MIRVGNLILDHNVLVFSEDGVVGGLCPHTRRTSRCYEGSVFADDNAVRIDPVQEMITLASNSRDGDRGIEVSVVAIVVEITARLTRDGGKAHTQRVERLRIHSCAAVNCRVVDITGVRTFALHDRHAIDAVVITRDLTPTVVGAHRGALIGHDVASAGSVGAFGLEGDEHRDLLPYCRERCTEARNDEHIGAFLVGTIDLAVIRPAIEFVACLGNGAHERKNDLLIRDEVGTIVQCSGASNRGATVRVEVNRDRLAEPVCSEDDVFAAHERLEHVFDRLEEATVVGHPTVEHPLIAVGYRHGADERALAIAVVERRGEVRIGLATQGDVVDQVILIGAQTTRNDGVLCPSTVIARIIGDGVELLPYRTNDGAAINGDARNAVGALEEASELLTVRQGYFVVPTSKGITGVFVKDEVVGLTRLARMRNLLGARMSIVDDPLSELLVAVLQHIAIIVEDDAANVVARGEEGYLVALDTPDCVEGDAARFDLEVGSGLRTKERHVRIETSISRVDLLLDHVKGHVIVEVGLPVVYLGERLGRPTDEFIADRCILVRCQSDLSLVGHLLDRHRASIQVDVTEARRQARLRRELRFEVDGVVCLFPGCDQVEVASALKAELLELVDEDETRKIGSGDWQAIGTIEIHWRLAIFHGAIDRMAIFHERQTVGADRCERPTLECVGDATVRVDIGGRARQTVPHTCVGGDALGANRMSEARLAFLATSMTCIVATIAVEVAVFTFEEPYVERIGPVSGEGGVALQDVVLQVGRLDVVIFIVGRTVFMEQRNTRFPVGQCLLVARRGVDRARANVIACVELLTDIARNGALRRIGGFEDRGDLLARPLRREGDDAAFNVAEVLVPTSIVFTIEYGEGRSPAAGFVYEKGSNYDKYVKGSVTVTVGRHREISDEMAKVILRQAGLR